jgi:hypothetical protein
MKTSNRADAESSGAAIKHQTSKLAETFEDEVSTVLMTFETNWEFEMSDGLRGALYMLRGHVTDLIESGRALAGLPPGEALKETPTKTPGEMLAICAKPGGTGYRPFGPVETTDDIWLARLHIACEYERCRALEYHDGIACLDGLRACMEGNAKLEPEREALRTLDKDLGHLMALCRTASGRADGLGRQLTGVESWFARKLDGDKVTLGDALSLFCTAHEMLQDSPASKDTADAVGRMIKADCVLFEMKKYNESV